jgi:DNA-binding HxlR family transcriptional regulator
MQEQTKERRPAVAGGDCPMTLLIGVIASKWAMPVLYNLLRSAVPVRFTVLRRSIGRVTQRELSLTLKRFEEIGVVQRQVYAEVPARVEYRLTPLGRSLEGPILALGRWAERHAGALAAAGKRAARAKALRPAG